MILQLFINIIYPLPQLDQYILSNFNSVYKASATMRKSLCLFSLAFSPLLLDGQQNIDTKRHAICILYPN